MMMSKYISGRSQLSWRELANASDADGVVCAEVGGNPIASAANKAASFKRLYRKRTPEVKANRNCRVGSLPIEI
jgi:hypothetical protein